MIRTALTLNISPADLQNCSYLANGTHLGLLSQTAQNIHVQTNHRPSQLVVAIRADETTGTSLTRQRQTISAWQDFAQLLSRRGIADLNSMLQQYHLQPDWLVCLDETHVQAWLPDEAGFYLLRQENLRRLGPIPTRDLPWDDINQAAALRYYTFSIEQDDQIFILPPQLLSFFASGEASGLLLGLRQLPARMSDLFNTARQRGFDGDYTWLAVQITHLERDEQYGELRGRTTRRSLAHAHGQQAEEEDAGDDSLSLSESQDQLIVQEPPQTLWQKTRQNPIWLATAAVLALAIIVVIGLTISHLIKAGRPQETSSPTTATSTSLLPSPTPSVKPTLATTTASPLPQLRVTARQLNLRDGPSRDNNLLLTLVNGDLLTQLGEPKDDWVKVRTADGLVGYVYYTYVEAVTP